MFVCFLPFRQKYTHTHEITNLLTNGKHCVCFYVRRPNHTNSIDHKSALRDVSKTNAKKRQQRQQKERG